MTPRHDRRRLLDILEAIDLIAEYTASATVGGDAAAAAPGALADAVLYRLVILGEAANALDPTVMAQMPEIRWSDVVGMRNLVAHEYFRIDWEVVRETIDRDLEPIRAAVVRVLRDIGDPGGFPS